MAATGWAWRLCVARFAQDTGMLINQMPRLSGRVRFGHVGRDRLSAHAARLGAHVHARRRALGWVCVAGFAACIAATLSIFRTQSSASAAGQRALHLSQMEMRLPLTLVLMGGMLCAAHMPRFLQKLLDNR